MLSFPVKFQADSVSFFDRRDPDALPRWCLVGALAACAAFVRLAGLAYGLPALFNGDEPHLIDTAVSFGRGSLDPGVFKYPTLWMYVLFAAFGVYFLLWSGLGLRRTVRDFGHLFVWHRGRFYLIGRALSAAASLAALERVYAAGRRVGPARAGLWAAALLAASPKLVEMAHAAKPDSLMLFWAAACWACALDYLAEGRPRSLLASAGLAGLAASTQYTALPVAGAPLLAWLLRKTSPDAAGRPSWGLGAAAAALVPAAFLAGSPYVLLDFPAFRRSMADHAVLELQRAPAGLKVLANAASIGGPIWLCAPLLVLGYAALLRRETRVGLLLLLPPAAHVLVMMPSDMGVVFRYLAASLPALALAAGRGVEEAAGLLRLPLGRPAVQAALLAALFLPGGLASARWSVALRRPDTRLEAAAWIDAHIPPGTRILTGAEVDGPPLRMSKEEAERLYARTKAIGHPRARYYQLMAESHPGGGYDVMQWSRPAGEMDTAPWHRRWSEAGWEMVDVSAGLAAARAAGAQVAVLSSSGLGLGTPSIEKFLTETAAQGRLLAEFRPEAGRVNGPTLRIYRIDGGGR
ncbi:MAG: glycosyltransferase family 39 protein [Elusimicrobia bacterium]|nr:glycosyltransferase family 39 protein [Elusimicrobiota bacterium]